MAEIIASVLAESVEQVRSAARRAAMSGADWLELRLDTWSHDESVEELVEVVGLPLLLSCRTPEDGGGYRGTLGERRELFERGLDAGARAVDLELWEEWSPRSDHLVIRSHHDFKGVTPDLRGIRDRLLDRGDVAKVVCMAHDLVDAGPLLELLASSDPEREPTVAFAMGQRAMASRVLSCALGAPYVYAMLDDGTETAPGQLPVSLVSGLYRARNLGPQTRIGGVLGDPARHSLGPWLHNRAMRAVGMDAVYLPFETSRPRELFDLLPSRRLVGLSVTAPHKQAVAEMCHRLTPEAEATAAINTLTFDAHGVLVGHNTDVHGVRAAFERAGWQNGKSGVGVVIGGGGAARAGAVALRDMGLDVMILTRTLDRVRDFASEQGFVVGALRADLLERTAPLAVVHATPVGSPAGPAGRVLPDWSPRPGCFVLDMVYQPRETELLRAVAAAGGVPVYGMDMFLAQAAEQVACMLGEAVSVDTLRGYLAGMDLDG